MKYIWNNSFLNCGNWKIGKLENLLRWLFFTFIYYRSSRMNYFIYTSHHLTPHGRYELNKLTSLLMCGFIAQLVEQRTGNGEVTGSNPVEALIFSGFFFPIALIGKFTAMITLHFFFLVDTVLSRSSFSFFLFGFCFWFNLIFFIFICI